MSSAVFRLLSLIYASLPFGPARKEALKAFVYRNFGWIFGRSINYHEWLRANPRRRAPILGPPPLEPTAEAWQELAKRDRPGESPALPGTPYVVVPVHRGRVETLACLYSVRASQPDVRLVVIDDATPDRHLREALARLAQAGHFELLHNERNQGFLRTANRGLALDPTSDVVLLNADTEVYDDWLARLNTAAHRGPRTGSVTPLSNNGDIASYPRPRSENRQRLEVDHAGLDALAREANAGLDVEVPTGVGFCLYLRRDCLNETGGFDEQFAAGYGEENDLCLRARQAGWRSVIATDVYVRHAGATSFGVRGARLRERAMAEINLRHPGYPTELEDFERRDPLRHARLRLDAARVRRDGPVSVPVRSILFVLHDWGGGVEQHVRSLSLRLAREGVRVSTLRVRADRAGRVRLELAGPPERSPLECLPSAVDIATEDAAGLRQALGVLGIDHVHVHHLGDWGERGAAELTALCAELGVTHDVTLHDYAAICPRLHLHDSAGLYCGEPDRAACHSCLVTHGSRFGVPDLAPWDAAWRALLKSARRVFCPTEDQLRRMRQRWPEPAYVVRGHPEVAAESASNALPRVDSKVPLRVLVPGLIGQQKGLDLLIACAEDARSRRLPLEFCIVGESLDEVRARRAGIERTGRHAPGGDEAAIRAALGPKNVAWIPSRTPETWSYALSAILDVGLYPVVFDLGAQSERVHAAGRGLRLALSVADRPAEVNDAFLSIEVSADLELLPVRNRPESSYETLVDSYYEGFASAPVSAPRDVVVSGATTLPEPEPEPEPEPSHDGPALDSVSG